MALCSWYSLIQQHQQQKEKLLNSPESNRLPHDILKSITLNFINGYALLHPLIEIYGKNRKTEIQVEESVKDPKF